MLRFGRFIPITIHPLFWVIAVLIGWLNSWSPVGTLLWTIVILVSLLVHEYGHALTAKGFGQRVSIELVAMGGLTYHRGKKLKPWQDFLIILMGPLAGFLLFVAAYFIRLSMGPQSIPLLIYALTVFVYVNLFWTIVNLLPIMPLDGGQLLRVVAEKIFGYRGMKITLVIGMTVAVLLAVASFLYGLILLGAILLLLAFESFTGWNRIKDMTFEDKNEKWQNVVAQAGRHIQEGKEEEAIIALREARQHLRQGMLFDVASEQLAFLFDKKGDSREVYDILKPSEKKLSVNGRMMLHKAAYLLNDYPLVAALGSRCFEDSQSYEVAYRNAVAAAFLKDRKGTLGWLECAVRGGIRDCETKVRQKEFDFIREDPAFLRLFHS